MITATDFCDSLLERGYSFYTVVPCSVFKHAINEVLRSPHLKYVMAANEGAALAIAAGAWLSRCKSVVLLQNSGVGNLINPLSSLSLPYHIPSLLFVSARAYPDGVGDEPQHVYMGAGVRDILKTFGVRRFDMPGDLAGFTSLLDKADEIVTRHENSVVIMVPKGSIKASRTEPEQERQYSMSRHEAIRIIAGLLSGGEAVISTTGKISRELFATQDRQGNFYMQGSMGYARAIALGVALNRPERRVVVLDGDGAALMHMGSFSTVGYYAPPNLVDIVLDNEAHGSTGNQATTSVTTALDLVAKACSYRQTYRCETADELRSAVGEALRVTGPTFILVKVNREESADMPRITTKHAPDQSARTFREFLLDSAQQ
ncbi:MAG TPA: phosphonopyruvate decarboxylase [Blastocatellia bacterium]|nr:phosphonopyruvate decarboxylase [Blastocatellia bacterium]